MGAEISSCASADAGNVNMDIVIDLIVYRWTDWTMWVALGDGLCIEKEAESIIRIGSSDCSEEC